MDRGDKPVLVLGATGYVGGRLLPVLLERGCKVRAVGRSADKIQSRSWGSHPNLEIIVADALDTAALTEAMRGCRAVFYLIHSIRPGEHDFFLEFRVQVLADGSNELRMTPSFEPHGVWGRVYWWIIAPSHALLFGSMLKQMVKAAGANVLSGPSCVRQC